MKFIFFIPKIPSYIILQHLSMWTGLKEEFLRQHIGKNALKTAFRMGLEETEVLALKDVNLSLLL